MKYLTSALIQTLNMFLNILFLAFVSQCHTVLQKYCADTPVFSNNIKQCLFYIVSSLSMHAAMST